MKTQHVHPKLILGSSSLYRRELLQRLNLPFETANPAIDEIPFSNEEPAETASRLAETKARSIAVNYTDALIISADQVVETEGMQLGKPLTHSNAVKQLRFMQGKEVIFHTALCLLNSRTNRLQRKLIPYVVKYRKLSDHQIERYLSQEQPYHCAGSAKSEGLGIALIERMSGDDPTALIGLPLISLVDMLMEENVAVI